MALKCKTALNRLPPVRCSDMVMRQYLRKKVVRFETRTNTSPDPESRRLWPECSLAILECGHRHNLGAGTTYRPKRIACWECGPR